MRAMRAMVAGVILALIAVGCAWRIPIDIIDVSENFDQDIVDWSADGRYLLVQSSFHDETSGTTFVTAVRDRVTGETVSTIGLTSSGGSISGDGRFVAYTSAPDVDPGDSVEFRDVFLLDRLRDTTTILTVTPLGDPSNGGSSAPQISDDGSTVVFNSSATNLVVNDADPEVDVYRWDAATRDLSLLSTRPDGPSANGTSIEPYVSSDGSVVVFSSSGTDLVEGDTNDTYDVFVSNDGSISRWSMTSEGAENDTWARANGISGDGSTVFFRSHSATLVPGGDSFLSSYAATAPGEVELVDVATNGEPLSADGSAVWDSSDDGSLVLVVAGGENPGGQRQRVVPP